MTSQSGISCMLMRGGTSKGPYFDLADIPADPAVRDRFLLAAMGSPDPRQIDGLGGADTLTSKVAIVGRSRRQDADLDYLFAQVGIEKPVVDVDPSCGNMLAGVGPFAIERGMIAASPGETRVVIYNINTSARIEAVIETPDGVVRYDGDAAIAGVPGTAAPVKLNFMDIIGSKTGAMLPTGKAIDVIDGVETTLIDVAMPMVLMRATDLGKSGYETPAELDADGSFFARVEAIRLEAGRRMGLGDVSGKVIPKIGILAPPQRGATVTARYFVPHRTHAAFAVTGALCVASCAVLEESVAAGIAEPPAGDFRQIVIEHPSGTIEVVLSTRGAGASMQVLSGGLLRTARKIMDGTLFVPASVLTGVGEAQPALG
jgi:2-methylaconitate cis-trans-isomerase PrpF